MKYIAVYGITRGSINSYIKKTIKHSFMWIKNGNNWVEDVNYVDETDVVKHIEKLRVYAKGLVAAGYSLASNLDDVYEVTRSQHSFWVINVTAVVVDIEGVLLQPYVLTNLTKALTKKQISASITLRQAIYLNRIKAANALLFTGTFYDWFLSYVPGVTSTSGHTTLLIPSQFTDAHWLEVGATSNDAMGYSVTNVANSDAVYRKLLRNYHLIQLVSTVHLTLRDSSNNPVLYPLATIDNAVLKDEYVVLLINQDNPTENGLYVYKNSSYVPYAKWVATVNFSDTFVYIQEGDHAQKEFALQPRPNGTFPELGEPMLFVQKEAYVVRNEIAYTLPEQHTLSAISYINNIIPSVTQDYNHSVSHNNVVYSVNTDRQLVTQSGTVFGPPEASFHPQVFIEGDTLYAVYVLSNLYHFYAHNILTNETTSKIMLGSVSSFCVVAGECYYGTDMLSNHRIYTTLNQANANVPLLIHTDNFPIREVSVCFHGTSRFVFFTQDNEIWYHYATAAHRLCDAPGANKLRSEEIVNDIQVSWLFNNKIDAVSINALELIGMSGWDKKPKVELVISGKRSIGNWSVNNGRLLKNNKAVTGITPSLVNTIPKLNNYSLRYFDGVDDFVSLHNNFNTLITNDNLTIEFTVEPHSILPNTPVFYLGDEVIAGADLLNPLQVRYIGFFIADTTGYPYAVFSYNQKQIVLKSTVKAAINRRSKFALSWDQTTEKTVVKLYLDGTLVADYTDTKTAINPQISLSQIVYTKNFIGKSENDALPMFRGLIGEFRVWNKALNDAQISARLTGSVDTKDILYKNLLHYLPMTDNTSVLVDLSTGANNAIFSGGVKDAPLYVNVVNVAMIQQDGNILYLLANTVGVNRIFSINILTEQVQLLYTSEYTIKSICIDGPDLYYMTANEISTLAAATQTVSNDCVDFCVIDGIVYLFKGDSKLYAADGSTVLYIYNDTLDCLYGNSDGSNTVLYLKSTDGIDTVIISGTDGFSYLGQYPLASNQLVVFGDDEYRIRNNKLFIGDDVIATKWSDSATVFGLYRIDNLTFLLGVIEEDRHIEAWVYNVSTQNLVRVCGRNGTYTLGVSGDGLVDFCVFTNANKPNFLVLNNETRSIAWYGIEFGNKANFNLVDWKYTWLETGAKYRSVSYVNNVISLLETDAQNIYFVVVRNDSELPYNLWKRDTLYTTETVGFIAADNGILLNDINNVLTDVSLANRDDLLDLHVLTQTTTLPSGVIAETFSDKKVLVGNRGAVFLVNGDEVIRSEINTNHTLHAVSFYDDANGWAVGDRNSIYFSGSSGSLFVSVVLPDEVGIHDWFTVLQYNTTNALIGGSSGQLLHLVRSNDIWTVQQQPSGAYNIALTFGTEQEEDLFFKRVRRIVSLSSNTFAIVGDSDFICIATLDATTKMRYYYTETDNDWANVVPYFNPVTNETSLILQSNHQVVIVNIDNYKIIKDGLLHPTTYKIAFTTDKILNDISLADNTLIISGSGTLLKKMNISNIVNNNYVYTFTDIATDTIVDLFKARFLFLDYFVARKVNLHTTEKTRIVPVGLISKSSLVRNRISTNGYLEFMPYGAAQQANFLSYQDFYLLNRRSFATRSMAPWLAYNKRLVAVLTATYNQQYVAYVPIASLQTTKLTVGDSLSTRLLLNGTPFSAQTLDVVEVSIVNTLTSIKPTIGDRISLQVIDESGMLFDIIDSAVIEEDDKISFKEFTFFDWVKNGKTLTQLQADVLVSASTYYNVALRTRCLTPPTTQALRVELRVVRAQTTQIVTERLDSGLVFGEVWNPDMIEDLNKAGNAVLLRNLNYFNGDLQHLQNVFADHLLGQSYVMDIAVPNSIKITGKISPANVYHNLDVVVRLKISGTITANNVEYDKKYVYTPNYSLERLLAGAHQSFTPAYQFANMPQHTYALQAGYQITPNNFTEFSFGFNHIYAGQDLPGIRDYKAGTFIDLINNTTLTVEKVFILRIEEKAYANYPTKTRLIFHTQSNVQLDANGMSGDVQMRMRNTLREVSTDLEITDNINFPLTNGGVYDVQNMNQTYFTQLQVGGGYANFLLNDAGIRKHISAVAYMDEQRDWCVNVVNWEDSNLTYRPTDVYKIGTDYHLTKPIAVDDVNYNIVDDCFGLINIDFDKFTFLLVDGLSLKALESNYHWVLNATLRDAVIGQNENGLVWYSGTWLSGTWEHGMWLSGSAYNIHWISGDMYAYKVTSLYNQVEVDTFQSDNSFTTWYNGTWENGTFHAGTWENGTWENGTWENGTWISGVHKNGTWVKGRFDGGLWLDGVWSSGNFSQNNATAIWYNGAWNGGDFENGVWKNGVWNQTGSVRSRFGTKASYLKKAIWEYGTWKDGTFYSGTVNRKGVMYASENYSNSRWYNGTWERGSFFGGTWYNGVWRNGIWYNGLMRSSLNIIKMSLRDDNSVELQFDRKHYYKDLKGYVLIMGKPVYVAGKLDDRTAFLGHNAQPTKHYIREILDEKTVLIAGDTSLSVTTNNTLASTLYEQLAERCRILIYPDYSILPVHQIATVELYKNQLSYAGEPRVATHWVDGTWYGGIFEYGYFNDGYFKGGMWNDGVFEQGTFGE